ncbi:MAG: hypothetical protein ACOX1H_07400 [Pseudoramibacter sp.]|jgi:hypothetical protein
MREFSAKVIIDDETYTEKQLARYQYGRTLHVLHEMKRLGASFQDGGRILSDEDLNWLAPEKAEQLLLEKKAGMTEQEALELFDVPERDAERRWKAYAADYNPANAHLGVTEVQIKGIGIQETMAVLGGAGNKTQALGTFPDHFIVIGDIHEGQRGMETFGMFGEPVYVHGTSSDTIPEGLPVEVDESYPMRMFGEMLLKRDDTPIHVGAYHMFRPTPDGFDVKSTFFCPGKAPEAVAEGHKMHFALEIVNSARYAYTNAAR